MRLERRDAPTSRFIAIRAEIQNLQLSNLAQAGPWSPFYTHGVLRQGHTQLGQVLGSEAGPGGAGSVIAVESYSPSGRWTWSWTRMVRQQRGDSSGATPDPNGVDVQHALAVERLQRRGGGRYELLARVEAVYELNRNFTYDAFDVSLMVGVRVHFLHATNPDNSGAVYRLQRLFGHQPESIRPADAAADRPVQ